LPRSIAEFGACGSGAADANSFDSEIGCRFERVISVNYSSDRRCDARLTSIVFSIGLSTSRLCRVQV
jgi:hypothetical protein